MTAATLDQVPLLARTEARPVPSARVTTAVGQSHRLAGGSIDRARPLGFSFDGRAYSGFAGDTLASALVANGVKLVARSFKYPRPRGILTAGAEDGHVFDDGTAARLADDHYYLTTTTANAARVMQHLEHARQILWASLEVRLASATDQWAQYALAGPRSRALLAELLSDAADVSDAALPYIAAFRWCGVPTRLFRLSFSGERAYEIAVPSAYGDALIRAVEALDATPYGTEALGVMRIEKGHAAGNELDGRTTAADLGVSKMLSTKKNFIGRAMAAREGLTDPARPRLTGFVPVDRAQPLRAGAHLLAAGAPATAAHDEGWLSSAAHSLTLGHAVALGCLAHGAERVGERVRAYDPVRGGDTLCEVVLPVFVDPEGARLRG